MSKWVYKILVVYNNTSTTHEYDKDDVEDVFTRDGNLVVQMKNGAYYGFNQRYVISWRLIEA